MVETRKLKGKLVELGLTVADLAEALGVSQGSVYRKLKDPDKITVRDARAIAQTLRLTAEETQAIFFAS